MFKWINKWLNKKVEQALNEARNSPMESDGPTISIGKNSLSSGRTRHFEQNGMKFTIYQAVGGHIMEYSCYDERTDNNNRTLHIITADSDLGQSIAHIITYEMLKK
jgi:hypothetical protein